MTCDTYPCTLLFWVLCPNVPTAPFFGAFTSTALFRTVVPLPGSHPFVPRLPMAIFWNLVQICWPHPFLVSLTPLAMFWIPSLNILTSFSVPPPEESTFQSIPTLWHLFRSIPIEMPHPHPAAFLFKCDPVQMPQSAPCGTFSNPPLLKYLVLSCGTLSKPR